MLDSCRALQMPVDIENSGENSSSEQVTTNEILLRVHEFGGASASRLSR